MSNSYLSIHTHLWDIKSMNICLSTQWQVKFQHFTTILYTIMTDVWNISFSIFFIKTSGMLHPCWNFAYGHADRLLSSLSTRSQVKFQHVCNNQQYLIVICEEKHTYMYINKLFWDLHPSYLTLNFTLTQFGTLGGRIGMATKLQLMIQFNYVERISIHS